MHLKKPEPSGFFEWIKLIFCGCCIGASDIIPGISGGTMAFILGIYEDLIASLNSLSLSPIKQMLKGEFRLAFKQVAWKFLLAVVAGIVLAIASLSQLLQIVLNDHVLRSYLYSLFFGLIIASVYLLGKKVDLLKVKHLLGLILGAVAAFILSFAPLFDAGNDTLFDIYLPVNEISEDIPISNYNQEKQLLLDVPSESLSAMLARGIIGKDTVITRKQDGKTASVKEFAVEKSFPLISPWFLFCGMVAISAMLLPGISGSYLLVLLGAYATVIGAVADFVAALKSGSFDQEAFFILFSLLIGIVIGAILFSRAVKWFLEHHHDTTLSTLMGFMLGALPVIWPFFSYEYVLLPLKPEKGPQLSPQSLTFPSLFSESFLISLGFAFLGIGIVLILHKLSARSSE